MHKYILLGLFIASAAFCSGAEDAKFNDPTASSFASDVAVSGDFALVGASGASGTGNDVTGAVYSYQKSGGEWVFDEQFFAPDGEDFDLFGSSVAMSGEVAIIGAPRDDDPTDGDDSGSAYLFRHDGSDWVFEQKITASDVAGNRQFGGAVAISGTVAVVGFRNETGAPGGTAYVFRYNGTTWVEEAILTASDAVAGDEFGAAVAVFDDVVVVGATEKSGGGAAYIYRNTTGTTWVEERILTASDGVDDDEFGDAVAISGSLAIIGANREGAAYIYRHTGGSTWDETKITRENGTLGGFGDAVAISGEVALVGAAQAESNQGTGHLFRFNGSEWVETVLVPSNPGDFGDPSSNFWFGDSVALSGDYAILGAAFDSGFGGNGAAFLYNLAPEITWNVPADITYGTALSSTQLNATSDVPGTFSYSPASGIVLDAGDHTLTVNFTPTDTARYASASATVSITILVVDDYLPGFSFSFGSVSIGGQTTGEIETSGDVDGFRVFLQANTTYEISILGSDSNNGTLIDPDLLGIFSSSDLSGTPISSVQTLNTQIVADDSISFFTPQNAGEYFISVRDSEGGVGTYTVAVDDIGVRDDVSADLGTTGSIVPGGSALGRVDFAQDNDWFEVNLSANRLYEISLVPLAGGNALSDPFFRGVYDSNGVLIGNTENDDGGTGTSSALQFVTDNAGTFYLSAGGFGDTTGQYRLELNDPGVLDNGRFDITIEFTSDDVPNSYIEAFEDAVERWEGIIVGDLPYAFVEGYGYVDDILIEVAVADFELVFEGVEQTILALSNVLDQRNDAASGSGALPTYSRIVIDSQEVGELLNLDEFVQSTIGRALGFGSLWEEFGIVRDIDGVATYTGLNGLREMAELSEWLNDQIVLEDGADGGLAAEYWSEGILDNELMTSRVELRRPHVGPSVFGRSDNPISILTIAAMQDLGYQVNYDAADHYSLPPLREWVSTGSGQQLRVSFTPENQSNNIIDIKPDENGEVLDDVIIMTGDSEAPSEEKRQLGTIRFGGASNETIDLDGENFGDDTVMNFTVAGVNDLKLKSLDTTNAGRGSLTVDSTNHSGTLNATGGSPAIDGGVGTVLLKFVNDNDQAGSGGVDLEDGVSQYASVITFDDPGTSGEGENEFGIEYNVGEGETFPYAGVSSQALEDIDATMHDGVISLGVISEFSREEFDLNAGETGQVFACLGIALDDGVAETPTLSATGTWTFDGSPGGYAPAGGLNNLDIEIKNIEIESGGHLVFTNTDICIAGHINLSAAVLDIDAGSTVKVLPGGQLSLTVEQANELQDVLQGISINIVSSDVDPPEISVEYSGTNIEDGDSSPSTVEGTDFGSQDQTSGSETRTFRVSNTGESTLTLGAASSSSGEFSVSGLASSISRGSFDDFTVTFDPSSVGTKTATISFSTNDSNENPFNFTVRGEGTSWYGSSVNLGGGWRWFAWFGSFNVSTDPWIYHAEHGWLYPFADDPSDVYFWDSEMESIVWTSESAYPSIYRFSDAKWLFYQKGSSNPRWFVNLLTGQWEQW